MANIGTFTTNGGGFAGHIETLTLSAPTTIQPVTKGTDKAPDYRLRSHGAEIGAAWEKQAKDGQRYLSVQLDDPSFAAPIHCALLQAEDGKYNLVWSR
jgi:uncharacterized protein (DUF736 family)